MATAIDLYRSFEAYLRLSAQLVALTGQNVNVGEKFTMRFTVTNNGPDPSPVNNPIVVFNSVKFVIEGTEFATPTSGQSVTLSAPNAKLWPGQSSSVDVEMKALKNMGGFVDLFSAEKVSAAVWAFGDIDLAEYFKIWVFRDVNQEIQPT